LTKEFDNPSLLLDNYFAERDLIERMSHRSHDLLKMLSSTSDRIARRISSQKTELLETENRDISRIKGDIINANLYQIQKGMSSISLPNFYEENSPLIEIELDATKTPAQNAQRYFNEYRKADNAKKVLVGLISEGEAEYEYIDSVFDALTRAKTEAELNQIREELVLAGYAKAKSRKYKKPEKIVHHKFKSSDGFTILVGKNNIGNDKLTLKDSNKHDLWLHTHNIPGSHTVIVTEGQTPPDRTITEAAILAAYHSKAASGSQVPVDYTPIKFVKKPVGAKPGKVIYETYQTAYVTPDKELIAKLLIK
ncbi:MAG: NFACT family protein, partial [Oscillospiraceae bacterium]|nr:NFACT family protein [Oscillospiraceae bacterium]